MSLIKNYNITEDVVSNIAQMPLEIIKLIRDIKKQQLENTDVYIKSVGQSIIKDIFTKRETDDELKRLIHRTRGNIYDAYKIERSYDYVYQMVISNLSENAFTDIRWRYVGAEGLYDSYKFEELPDAFLNTFWEHIKWFWCGSGFKSRSKSYTDYIDLPKEFIDKFGKYFIKHVNFKEQIMRYINKLGSTASLDFVFNYHKTIFYYDICVDGKTDCDCIYLIPEKIPMDFFEYYTDNINWSGFLFIEKNRMPNLFWDKYRTEIIASANNDDLSSYSTTELKRFFRNNKIRGYSKLTKNELVDWICNDASEYY